MGQNLYGSKFIWSKNIYSLRAGNSHGINQIEAAPDRSLNKKYTSGSELEPSEPEPIQLRL
jgi:hypothetical protein